MAEPIMAELVARLRSGKPNRPDYEVTWVQNLRAFIDTEMFRSFPEWRAIFREEIDSLLEASSEAADALEALTARNAALEDAIEEEGLGMCASRALAPAQEGGE